MGLTITKKKVDRRSRQQLLELVKLYLTTTIRIDFVDKLLDVTQLAADLLSDAPFIVDVAHPPVKTRVIAHLGALIEMMMHHAEHIFQFL